MKWPRARRQGQRRRRRNSCASLPGSIGYVELIYALQNKIPYRHRRRTRGNFVKASLESTTAAAAAA